MTTPHIISVSHSTQKPIEPPSRIVKHVLAARNVIPHSEDAIRITLGDITHEILIKLGGSIICTLLDHLDLSCIRFSGLDATNSRIACISGFSEQFKIGWSSAQAIQGVVCFFPNRILTAKMLQLIVALPLNVIGAILGYLWSYICSHVNVFLLSINIRFLRTAALVKCKS